MDSLISEQTWYLQSSARDDQEPINNFIVNNLSRLIRVNAGQKLKIYLVSFNGLNSFYNISNQNNTFYLNGVAKQLSIGFYTNFTDICTNIKNALGTALTVTTQAFTNKGVWTFAAGTPFTIQFPFGRNSHALMGIPFNYGNPYTITPTLVSGVWTYVTPSPMMYNYIQNINLRADGFPTPQNIEFLNNEGNDGALNYSTLFAKIPVTADPYQNIWFNPQDVNQYVSLSIGKNSGIERVNFQLTDDFQNLLQCDYDWEAVFKVEVYEDILIRTLNKGMGTNQVDDSSYLKAGGDINGTLQDFVGHFRGAFDNGDTHSGGGSVFKDGAQSVVRQIRDGINENAKKLNEISGHLGVGGQIPIVMGTSAGVIGTAIAGAAVTTVGGMEAAAATTVGGMEAAAGTIVGGLEAAAGTIVGGLEAATAAEETQNAGVVEAIGAHAIKIVESMDIALTAYKEVNVKSSAEKAAKWVKTLETVQKIITIIKYIEDIATETKNVVKQFKDVYDMVDGIRTDDQKAAKEAAEKAAAVAAQQRQDIANFEEKLQNIADKIDFSKIDFSTLDLDLGKLDLDLGKLDIDLGELKNITAAITDKDVGVSGIVDELSKIEKITEESRDIFKSVEETFDHALDIAKKDMNIFDTIGKNFSALVKHLTGQHGAKESYQELIGELKKFIEESNNEDVKPEVKTWISENKTIKYDPETSDKTSYNKLISTAVSLESKIKYEPLEKWIEKHREKS